MGTALAKSERRGDTSRTWKLRNVADMSATAATAATVVAVAAVAVAAAQRDAG